MIPPLHTEGKHIVDANGDRVVLRGCDFLEPAYITDKLRYGHPLSTRVKSFYDLGVNTVRIEVNYNKWMSNEDTNGDGVGNRDFTIQAVKAITAHGMNVIPGLHARAPLEFYRNPQAWADWLVDELVDTFYSNPHVVGVYILNEPKYGVFSSTSMQVYWNDAKHVCAEIYEANPELLMIVHCDRWNRTGFFKFLEDDPIPTPNVVYTWHDYFHHCPKFVQDYEECARRGQPYYIPYYEGNYAKARLDLEQWLYDKFLWVKEELNLPIICDEIGWLGNTDPRYAVELEPGWPQCQIDYTDILNRYDVSWLQFAWWPKHNQNYGLCKDDMVTLSGVGEVWADRL